MEQPLRSWMLKVPMPLCLSRLSQMANKKVYQLSLRKSTYRLSHSWRRGSESDKTRVIDWARRSEHRTSKYGTSKGEKRCGSRRNQKGLCAWWKFLKRKWCGESRKELDAFELDPVAEITEVGYEGGTSRYSWQSCNRSHSRNHNQSHSHNRFRTRAPHVSEGPESSYCNSSSILRSKRFQEGTDAVREGSRKQLKNASSFACSSFRRKVAKYGNGRKRRKPRCWNLAAGLASAVDDQKKSQKAK